MKRSNGVSVSALMLMAACVCAQPILVEPPDFSDTLPGPVVAHTGVTCLHVADGTITPGDVDWVQVTIGFASARTVVDVDFASPGGRSALLASVVGGATRFGLADSNKEADDLCGLGTGSDPIGSATDSVADVGPTTPGTIINIAVTGAGDSGFNGNHAELFDYELWVYVLREDAECMNDADCDDGVACTVDRCDALDGTCHNLPDDGFCDDGLFCTGSETCDPGDGCLSGTPPCPSILACDEANGRCVGCYVDADCVDTSFCNGSERCTDGVCQPGVVPACDDGVRCTVDFCDAEKDRCAHIPRNDLCNDHLFCNGRETCHPQDGCRPGKRRCRRGPSPWLNR